MQNTDEMSKNDKDRVCNIEEIISKNENPKIRSHGHAKI